MQKQIGRAPSSSSSSENDQEDRNVHHEYLRKLESYKLVGKQQSLQKKREPENSVPSESEDSDHEALKPCLTPQRQAAIMAKNQSERRLPNDRSVGVGLSRPLTSHSYKPKPPLRKIRANDPVARYQQMSRTWKSDKFLSGGANKKQGRKLELDKRCREYGLPL